MEVLIREVSFIWRSWLERFPFYGGPDHRCISYHLLLPHIVGSSRHEAWLLTVISGFTRDFCWIALIKPSIFLVWTLWVVPRKKKYLNKPFTSWEEGRAIYLLNPLYISFPDLNRTLALDALHWPRRLSRHIKSSMYHHVCTYKKLC